eukprot:410635-Prymnesium_polylepis.2
MFLDSSNPAVVRAVRMRGWSSSTFSPSGLHSCLWRPGFWQGLLPSVSDSLYNCARMPTRMVDKTSLPISIRVAPTA